MLITGFHDAMLGNEGHSTLRAGPTMSRILCIRGTALFDLPDLPERIPQPIRWPGDNTGAQSAMWTHFIAPMQVMVGHDHHHTL